MNTGQSLLTLCAMLLLSVTVLNTNKNFLNTNSVMLDSKLGILAVSLGTSLMEEAMKKSFDLASAEDAITSVSELTEPSGLGPSVGEYYPNYNDFDDYNGLVKNITNMPSADFKLTCQVYYVNAANANVKVNFKTWHKRINVIVTSSSMADTLKLSTVYSYWYFR